MKARLEEHAGEISDSVRPTLEAFINAPMGDEPTASEVALLEWEMDGVHFIFDKPRERQQGLAESTLYFFANDCKDPDVLLDQWRKHLEDLKARERRSDFPEDNDETFFSLHRRYIEEDPKLHSRWEKAIFGKPIECHDFLDGFVNVTHSLVVKAGDEKMGERFLRFTVNKGRKEWRERFNYDVGAYFFGDVSGAQGAHGLQG